MSLLQHSFVLNREKTIVCEWFEKSKKYESFVMKYFSFSSSDSYERLGWVILLTHLMIFL